MPLGGPKFIPFLMVEIHYNNPLLFSGYNDSSGLRITFTKDLRPFDAGIMELGLIYSDANSIPPLQKEWPLTGYCPFECTEKVFEKYI
jgi:dopamine beta-monooxygenase